MWSREELKSKAKVLLKRSYWKAFLVSFILAIVAGEVHLFKNSHVTLEFDNLTKDMERFFNSSSYYFYNGMEIVRNIDFMHYIPFIVIGFVSAVFGMIAVFAIKILVGYPLEVGAARYYISAEAGVDNLNFIGYAFRKDGYFNVVLTMFLRDLYVFLWSLLFIIPGIVKWYSYSMVPYILADNPNIDHSRAIEISRKMTRNHKWDIFVLDLSFLGWYILGSFLFGLGIYFVNPYYHATKMELYLTLRNKVLAEATCHPEEFSLVLQLPEGNAPAEEEDTSSGEEE